MISMWRKEDKDVEKRVCQIIPPLQLLLLYGNIMLFRNTGVDSLRWIN